MTNHEFNRAPLWLKQLVKAQRMDPSTVSVEISAPIQRIGDFMHHTSEINVTVRGMQSPQLPRRISRIARSTKPRRKK